MITLSKGPCDERPVIPEKLDADTGVWQCVTYENETTNTPMVFACTHQAATALLDVLHMANVAAVRGDLPADKVPHVSEYRVTFVDAVPSLLAADEPTEAAVSVAHDFLTKLIGH